MIHMEHAQCKLIDYMRVFNPRDESYSETSLSWDIWTSTCGFLHGLFPGLG